MLPERRARFWNAVHMRRLSSVTNSICGIVPGATAQVSRRLRGTGRGGLARPDDGQHRPGRCDIGAHACARPGHVGGAYSRCVGQQVKTISRRWSSPTSRSRMSPGTSPERTGPSGTPPLPPSVMTDRCLHGAVPVKSCTHPATGRCASCAHGAGRVLSAVCGSRNEKAGEQSVRRPGFSPAGCASCVSRPSESCAAVRCGSGDAAYAAPWPRSDGCARA